ncbi:MAG TPA: hypothetical protein VKS19_01645 [Verrucomicrobiae bacterium]|nr:hypothetical protein [Verrucomicrobiae bacterium]
MRWTLPFLKEYSSTSGPPIFSSHKRLCFYGFNQNGLVPFQKFLNGASAANGVGNSDGVGLGQFVMHQPFADEAHLEIQSRHPPDLTGFQWLRPNPTCGLGFAHF